MNVHKQKKCEDHLKTTIVGVLKGPFGGMNEIEP